MKTRTTSACSSRVLRLTTLALALVALPAGAQRSATEPSQEKAFSLCFQLELEEVTTEVTADSCTEAVSIPELPVAGTRLHLLLVGSYIDRPLAETTDFERRFGMFRAVRETRLPGGETRTLEDNHVLSWKTAAFHWSDSRGRFLPAVLGEDGAIDLSRSKLLRGDLTFRWLVPEEEEEPWSVDAEELVRSLWPLRWDDLPAEKARVGVVRFGIAPIPRLDVGLRLPPLLDELRGPLALRSALEDTTRFSFELEGEGAQDDVVRELLEGTQHEVWLPFVSYWSDAVLTLKGDGTARREDGRLEAVRVRARLGFEQELGWEYWWDGPSQVQGRHRERWTGDLSYRWGTTLDDTSCPHDPSRN